MTTLISTPLTIPDFISQLKPISWDNVDGVIQYYCTYTDVDQSISTSHTLFNNLPDTLKTASVLRQNEFLAGRFCARQSLEFFNKGEDSIAIGHKGFPLFPSGYKGSISHSKPLATSAVCNETIYQGIGTDIEKIVDLSLVAEIQHVVLRPVEYALLDQFDAPKNIIFTLIFTAKESFYKAVFPHINEYLNYDAVNVSSIDFDKQLITLHLAKEINPEFIMGDEFVAHFDFIEESFIVTLLVFKDKNSA